MAKFGKFLLTTAAIVGTVATAYGIYKHKDVFLKTVTDDDDEDYDDFSEEDEADTKPHYVPLNNEGSVSEAVKDVVEDTVDAVEDVAENVADTVEETIEKTVDTVSDVVENIKESADNFSTLPEQMVVEESVEEFFNDEN